MINDEATALNFVYTCNEYQDFHMKVSQGNKQNLLWGFHLWSYIHQDLWESVFFYIYDQKLLDVRELQ